VLDCAFSQEVNELFTSPAASYWQSPYLLFADIISTVCS
jgi:hypothetical protein